MPLLYMPSVLVCVLAFVHFGLFVGLIIVNVFIRDLERGKGARTTASRIMWGCKIFIKISDVLDKYYFAYSRTGEDEGRNYKYVMILLH